METPAVYNPDQLRAELESALASGDLALDAFDAEAFDVTNLTPDDFALDSQIQTRIHAPAKSRMLHPRLIRYENAQALAQDIGDFSEPGARVHAILNGNFIYGDFLEAWIKRHNWLIPDLYVATLSLSQDNLDSLANLLHGDYVQRLHLMVSDYWFAHERGNLVPYAYQELDLGGDRFQLTVTGSHCKLALIGTDTGAKLVLHGSANLRSSASIEQLAIEHDPALFDFHRDWLTALEAQYHTIHPDQPGPAAPKRQQWQTIAPAFAAPTTNAPAPPTKNATPIRKLKSAATNSANAAVTSDRREQLAR